MSGFIDVQGRDALSDKLQSSAGADSTNLSPISTNVGGINVGSLGVGSTTTNVAWFWVAGIVLVLIFFFRNKL